MRNHLCIFFAFAFAAGTASIFGDEKPETSRLAFVTEYLRELAAIENINASAEQKQKQEKSDVFSNAIHTGNLMQLELGSQIRMLKGMRLNPPFEELIPNITGFYEEMIALYKTIIDIGSAFIGGPKPGIEYDKLAAEMPKTRAGLEYLDHALFDAAPVIFATLIDLKPDSKNHASHLIITKAERAELIRKLNDNFGSKVTITPAEPGALRSRAPQRGWITTNHVQQKPLQFFEPQNVEFPMMNFEVRSLLLRFYIRHSEFYISQFLSLFDIGTLAKGMLRELSNFCCLPGRAGGPPFVG